MFDRDAIDSLYSLVGNITDRDLEFLQNFDRIIFISGEFGSGKTTLIKHLLKTGNFLFLSKRTTRRPRKNERSGIVPFNRMRLVDLYDIPIDEPMYFCINVNTRHIFDDKVLETLIESDEWLKTEGGVFMELLSQFLSIYLIKDVVDICNQASSQKKIVLLEITPEQEENWAFFFPYAKVVRLHANPNLRIARLIKRVQEDPSIDPNGLVTKIKIKQSISEWADIRLFPLSRMIVENNSRNDLVKIIKKVMRLSEGY